MLTRDNLFDDVLHYAFENSAQFRSQELALDSCVIPFECLPANTDVFSGRRFSPKRFLSAPTSKSIFCGFTKRLVILFLMPFIVTDDFHHFVCCCENRPSCDKNDVSSFFDFKTFYLVICVQRKKPGKMEFIHPLSELKF